MSKISKQLFLAFTFVAVLGSCSKTLIGTEKSNTATSNFNVLWQDFDEHYAAFIPKKVDWQAQYLKHRMQVTDTMSNVSLYAVLTGLLDVLDDNHIYLRPLKETGLPWYSGGILGRTKVEDYDRRVAETYLKEKIVYNKALEYGFIEGNIGYINLRNEEEDISVYYKAMDVILEKLKNTKGIIIELRENDGGEDRVSQYIANRFATQKHLSFSSRLKNGPGHADFAAPLDFFTEPEGSFQYTRPVIILTNLNVFSSGETFVLAMLQNSNVEMVGGITGGALSDAVERELPNGWAYRLPIADVRDAHGKNLEGVGITPHVTVTNTREDLQSGRDKVMEKAIQLLK